MQILIRNYKTYEKFFKMAKHENSCYDYFCGVSCSFSLFNSASAAACVLACLMRSSVSSSETSCPCAYIKKDTKKDNHFMR
mmetsp:Transcript_13357/g.19925  ORF Transcript_13357/g.19925 Transcript_13357/m.19925 type:complete len:81 (-) Transcript_13357:4-246(-)